MKRRTPRTTTTFAPAPSWPDDEYPQRNQPQADTAKTRERLTRQLDVLAILADLA
jgi:hypothetical protein